MLGDYTIEQAVSEAWRRMQPILRANPNELAIRLARRRSPILLRPPRAWCLAVRASDARISPLNWVMIPDKPVEFDRERHRRVYREHEVRLEARNLRRICAPFFIPKPGLDTRDLAKHLGVEPVTLWYAIKRGELSVHYYRGLEGRHGKPVPIVYSPHMIDPAGIPLIGKPDLIWGAAWKYLCHRIPEDVYQAVRRRPIFRNQGELKFRGWVWVCPGCGRDARRLFYPMPPLMLADFVDTSEKCGSPDAVQPPNATFACLKCHHIRYYTRVNRDGWNEFISHITGGLMYGHEVARPPGLKFERKRRYRRRPGRRPSKRDEQVTALLVNTALSLERIAAKLGLRYSSILGRLGRIYPKHGVHSREELRAKLVGERRVGARKAG